MILTTYEIRLRTGDLLGNYEGETPNQALDVMAHKLGYDSTYDAFKALNIANSSDLIIKALSMRITDL